jgi:hypothetical protein
MWSQHLQHLSQLAYRIRKDELDKTQLDVLWYTLYLDTQLCLEGNQEAGSFVRAYLADDSIWLSRNQLQHSHQEIVLGGDGCTFAAVSEMASFMCRQSAEMSQLALQLRKDANEGEGSISARLQCVENFHHVLHSGWGFRCRKISAQASPETRLRLTPLVRTMLDLVSLDIESD